MLTQAWNPTADSAVALLLHYIFDLGGHNARELVERWLRLYPANWVRLAAVEALYQGRYKAVSVEQILGIWQRRGQIQPHFNCEFERLVCGNVHPRLNVQQTYPILPAVHYRPTAIAPITPQNYGGRPTSRATEAIADLDRHRQLNNGIRHLHPVKTNTDRTSLRQRVEVASEAGSVENSPHTPSTTAEKRRTPDWQNQGDRYKSHSKRFSPSPASTLPRSSGSFHQPPIRQFNPGITKASDFCTKLKAISQYR